MAARSRLAVLMDPLDTIKPAKDSTIAMLRAAAQRGCEIGRASCRERVYVLV